MLNVNSQKNGVAIYNEPNIKKISERKSKIKFEIELSKKRGEAILMSNQIVDFLFNQTGLKLPPTKKEFIELTDRLESWRNLYKSYIELIDFNYLLLFSGTPLIRCHLKQLK
jgi:hypothetical protein